MTKTPTKESKPLATRSPETQSVDVIQTGLVPKEWNLAWEEFGLMYPRVKHGPPILAFLLFTFFGQSVLGIIAYFYVFLPWFVWVLTFLSTTVLAQMFVIRFSAKAFERKIGSLEAQHQPLLAIDYRPDEGAPFVQTGNGVVQYRVSVRSPILLNDAELVVNSFRKGGDWPPLFDIHLRPMHDRDHTSGTKRVRLPAKREKFWDVVSTLNLGPHGRIVVYLNCIPSFGVIELDPGEYEFELMATGGNRSESTKIVNLIVKKDYSVSFEVGDGRLSSFLA